MEEKFFDHSLLGYVTKQYLDQLITSVGLPEQQLLTIFQHLDKDENGLISLDEFVQGFLQFPLEEINNNSRLDLFFTIDPCTTAQGEKSLWILCHIFWALTPDKNAHHITSVNFSPKLDVFRISMVFSVDFTMTCFCLCMLLSGSVGAAKWASTARKTVSAISIFRYDVIMTPPARWSNFFFALKYVFYQFQPFIHFPACATKKYLRMVSKKCIWRLLRYAQFSCFFFVRLSRYPGALFLSIRNSRAWFWLTFWNLPNTKTNTKMLSWEKSSFNSLQLLPQNVAKVSENGWILIRSYDNG